MPQNLKIHQPDDRFFKAAMSDPEEQFLKQIKDTEFTIKPEIMSTLEQILERGRK